VVSYKLDINRVLIGYGHKIMYPSNWILTEDNVSYYWMWKEDMVSNKWDMNRVSY